MATNSTFTKLNSLSVDGLPDKLSSNQKQYFDDVKQDSDGDNISDVEEGCAETEGEGSKTDEKCLSPRPGYQSEDSSEENKGFETALQLIFSEPTPLQLRSAIKGSREKQGLSPRKLTVTWAPDVYDPPPKIILPYARNKKQQKSKNKDKDNYKKNGKKGQRGGSSSRGGGGGKDGRGGGKDRDRDKKQHRRNGRDRFIDAGDDKFEVGSPDTYCGGSFLINSLTKVHYKVAEAL